MVLRRRRRSGKRRPGKGGGEQFCPGIFKPHKVVPAYSRTFF